jgi:hypothetical protein
MCWCSKDPWMLLVTTTLGMCVRNKKCDEQLQEAHGQSIDNELLAIWKLIGRRIE